MRRILRSGKSRILDDEMKRDKVDILLQLAYLEGKINTHGAYEKSIAKKGPPGIVSASSRLALQRRLEAALTSERAEVPLTVGAFLSKVRSEQALHAQQIFSRIGLSQNIYRMLEHDRVSPLKISAETWLKLRRFFDLSADALIEMIRRTHQLVYFRPSFRTTLARYDSRKQKGLKSSTLEKAAAELFTKAKLSLPPDEDSKLNDLLKSIRQGS